jgi:hypothetical protein
MAATAEFGIDQMHGIGIERVIRSKVRTEHDLLGCFRQKLNCPIFRRFRANLISQYLPKVVADRREFRVELYGELIASSVFPCPLRTAPRLLCGCASFRVEPALAECLVPLKDRAEIGVRQGGLRVELDGSAQRDQPWLVERNARPARAEAPRFRRMSSP